ncbi:hypothetical protein Tco_0983816 [Tanacetum coccineum]
MMFGGNSQNGNSKEEISTGKDGIVSNLSLTCYRLYGLQEIYKAVEKEREGKNILLDGHSQGDYEKIFFHGMDDAKEIGKPSGTRCPTVPCSSLYVLQPIMPKKGVLAGFCDEVSIPSLPNNQRIGLAFT